jgi:hypothetical protein
MAYNLNFATRYIWRLLLVCLLFFYFAGCASQSNSNTEFHYFKLEGLNRLMQPATFAAEAAYIHHGLSKEGQPAPATEGGLGSLEDASRAVLVYLRHAEISGDTTNFVKARWLLTTVLHLQKQDGLFFDWIDAQGQPTLFGSDGADSFSYPEVRAMWALAVGGKAFQAHDRAFAERLHAAFWRSFVQVDSCLSYYGKFSEKEGMQFPQWLPFRGGAAAASELILAFDALLQSSLNDSPQARRLEQAMRLFSEGIHRMQAGNADQFPYGTHLAYESYWHGWGNCAMQALADRRRIQTNRLDQSHQSWKPMISYLICRKCSSRIASICSRCGKTPTASIIFHKRRVTFGLWWRTDRAVRVTGNRRYARRAGESARWFRGENKAHEAVYVDKSGLAKDNVKGNNYVVPDLTAAATVEALLAILEVEANRDSRKEFYVEIENLFEGKP